MQLNKISAIGLLLLTALIGGGNSPAAKFALQVFPPLTYIFLRFLIASTIMVALTWRELAKLKKKDIISLTGLSLLAISNIFFFTYGIRLTSSIVGQTLYVGVPVLALITTYILRTERVNSRKIVGIALGLVGSLLIILLPAWAKGATIGGNIWGNLLIMIAVVSFALYSVLSKRSQVKHSPLVVTTMFMVLTLFASSLALPYELAHAGAWWLKIDWASVLSVIYVGAIGTGGFYYLYQYTIKQAGATIASLVFYLLPVATFMWAYLLLGEVITLEFVLGATLIFWGASIAGKK